jgi:hypothetical protein
MYRFESWRNDATMANNFEGTNTSGPTTSTTIADASVTTTAADRLAVNLVSVTDDNALDAFTGMTGGTWAEAIAEYTTALPSPDVALGLQTATMASAGTIDGGTDVMVASDAWYVFGLAIIGTSYTPRNPAINHQNPGLLCKAHQTLRRWRHGQHGILVPDYALN